MLLEHTTFASATSDSDISSISQQETRNILIEIQKIEVHLRGFAAKLTRDSNIIDAENLYQDTLERARKKQHTFKKGTNLKAWISTIMKNNFINACRKQKNKITDFKDLASLADEASKSTDIESSIYYDNLLGMVDNLPYDLRIAFTLHFEGYKYQDIADELELPLGTVKSRIHFARKELQECILRDDPELAVLYRSKIAQEEHESTE